MKQKVKCDACKGKGEVGILRGGPRLFQDLYHKPMIVSPGEARMILMGYKGDDAGAMTMLIRRLARKVDSMSCPKCGGGGTAFVLTWGTPKRD